MPSDIDFSALSVGFKVRYDDEPYWEAHNAVSNASAIARRIRVRKRGEFRRMLEGRLFG